MAINFVCSSLGSHESCKEGSPKEMEREWMHWTRVSRYGDWGLALQKESERSHVEVFKT